MRGIGKESDEHAARCSLAPLEDFVRRSGLDEGVLSTLAEAGAFEGFGVDRRTALWDIRRLLAPVTNHFSYRPRAIARILIS